MDKIAEEAVNVVYKTEDATVKRQATLKFLSAQRLADKAKKAPFVYRGGVAFANDYFNKRISVLIHLTYRARE